MKRRNVPPDLARGIRRSWPDQPLRRTVGVLLSVLLSTHLREAFAAPGCADPVPESSHPSTSADTSPERLSLADDTVEFHGCVLDHRGDTLTDRTLHVKVFAATGGSTLQLRTDEQGCFRLQCPSAHPPRMITIARSRRAREPVRVRPAVPAAGAVDLGVMKLTELPFAAGRVTDGEGRPIDGVAMFASNRRPGRAQGWSEPRRISINEPDGHFWIEHQLAFEGREVELLAQRTGWAQPRRLSVAPGAPSEDLEIRLVRTASIVTTRLALQTPGGLELPLRWELQRHPDGDAPRVARRPPSSRAGLVSRGAIGPGVGTIATTATTIRWAELPPGRYEAILSWQEQELHRVRELALAPGQELRDPRMDRLDPGMHGRVFPVPLAPSDGRSLRGIDASLRVRGSRGGWLDLGSRPLPRWAVAPRDRPVDVQVRIPGYRPAEASVDPDTPIVLEKALTVQLDLHRSRVDEGLYLRVLLVPTGTSPPLQLHETLASLDSEELERRMRIAYVLEPGRYDAHVYATVTHRSGGRAAKRPGPRGAPAHLVVGSINAPAPHWTIEVDDVDGTQCFEFSLDHVTDEQVRSFARSLRRVR